MHTPDVVLAARDGEPTLVDPTPTLAPHVTKKSIEDFNESMNPGAARANPAPANAPAPAASDDAAAAPPPAAAPPAAPLQLQDVPAADAAPATGSAAVTSVQSNATSTPAASGNGMGVTIITPGVTVSPAENGGLKAVGPENATPLPAAEKPAGAPETVNDIAPGTQPAAQTPNANGKDPKPEFDKSDESSSKHKKKKGLAKLNPF